MCEGGGQFGEISKNDSIMEVRKTLKRNNIIIGRLRKFIKSNKINNYNIILNQERIKSNSEWGYGIEYSLVVVIMMDIKLLAKKGLLKITKLIYNIWVILKVHLKIE